MVSELLPAEILTIIDAISTAVLAIITYYYAKETRLIRKTAQHPSFSLESTLHSLDNNGDSSSSYKLSLTNNGLPANDIRVDCSWGTRNHPLTTNDHCLVTKKFYIMSLSAGSRTILDDVAIVDIVNRGEYLVVSVTCKDGRGEIYNTKLDIDFQSISSENRKIAYQQPTENREG
jgi:hypothetical protein